MLEINEHTSSGYTQRTKHNARSADLTVAFAVDFTTAGELLTHKASGDKYLGISLSEDPIQSARILYKELRDRNAHSLNIAGNGIYTLSTKGWTQDKINTHIHMILSKVHEHWPIEKIISGGQTGVDIAGITSAYALGIYAIATLPKGFIQRGTDKVDKSRSESLIREEVISWTNKLTGNTVENMAGSLRVVSKRKDGNKPNDDETVIEGDRTNPVFGNKYHLKNWWDKEDRARVISLHHADYERDVISGGAIYQEMGKIAERIKKGEKIALRCWCSPMPCHLDHISEGILKLVDGVDLQAEISAEISTINDEEVLAVEYMPSC